MLLSIFLILALAAGAIQVPYVQTKIVGYVSKELSQATGYSISLARIEIDWFDQIQIDSLNVLDPVGNAMIQAASVDINYQLSVFFGDTDPELDDIYLSNARITLKKVVYEGTDTVVLNFDHFIRTLKTLSKKEKTGSAPPFKIDHVTISGSEFNYIDPFKDSVRDGFDYNHFSIDNLSGEFNNFLAVSDTIMVNVQALVGEDRRSSLTVDKLSTDFFFCRQAMKFNELDLIVGKSRLHDSVIFKYSQPSDLNQFNTNVFLEANFEESMFHSHELAEFIPAFRKIDDYFELSGQFKGRVNSFQLSNLDLKSGNGSILRGKARLVGLPAIEETLIDFDLVDSYAVSEDLKKYLKPKTYARLAPLKNIGFNAEFFGFTNDFVANGDFFTQYGRVSSDINLKLDEEVNKSSYKGKLKMFNFDVGGYTGNRLFQKVTLNGQIEGRGFTLDQADFKLIGRVDSIGLNNYTYNNIKTDARFTKEFFEGYVNVNDPNLKLEMNGAIDIRGGIDFFNLSARLDTAFLKPLNLTKENIFVRSQLNVNAQGLKIDEILGSASFVNTTLRRGDQELQIDSLGIISDRDENIRNVFITTNLFEAKIDGDFEFTEITKDLKQLVYEYRLNLENDPQVLKEYYANKVADSSDYQINYKFDIRDFEPIANVFIPDLYISPLTQIDGNLIGGYTSIFNLQSYIDSVNYKGDAFLHNDIQANVSKISDSTMVLAAIYATSEEQILAGLATKDLFLEAIWNNKHIDFEFDLDQVRYPNYVRLLGGVDFLEDHTEIKLQPSDVHILDDRWTVQQDNLISIRGKEIAISNLNLNFQDQSIRLEGQLSEDPSQQLTLTTEKVDIKNLSSILNKELTGTLDGVASIRDYYDETQITSDLNLIQFSINEFVVGDITGRNVWNNRRQRFDIDLFIERLQKRVLEVSGNYSPNKTGLDLTARLDKTELKILEPFFDQYFTNIGGTTTGNLKITGPLRAPKIVGNGKINQATLHVNYLNTDYTFDGNFYLREDRIGFRNVTALDENGNLGYLEGYFKHRNFKNFSIDLGGSLDEFLVLNTTAKDNDLFYGTGIATGTIQFEGPLSNMKITANATTGRGTRIFIPIGESETIEQQEFINFVSLRDSSQTETLTSSKVDLRGLNLDFDLNITRDAYCEIIFDIKAGDIIRGRGSGDINLQINTTGDFNMFGDYTIEEGGYNFTLYNIINKEFEILPNSKISWYGDPYEGVMDISATYNQMASFLPLLQNEALDYERSPEIRRNYPVQVLLDIDGRLMSPEVEFDIVTGNLPRNIQVPQQEGTALENVDLELEFTAFKNSIDEQELKRQVFSLIILKRFSPLQSFDTGGSISSSVSELLSNQLSYWVTQVDENLEIDLDLGALDSDATNTFQLRLSYTFLDGRLRVTRDGGFTNQQNRADVNSIAGDWTVEYLLTPDGKLKAKMYNRTNYNPVNPNEETQNTTTTGFSLIHTQSFDEIRELFKKSREKTADNQNRPQPTTVDQQNAQKKDGTVN